MPPDLHFKTSMDFAYGTPSPVSPGVVRLVANNPGPLTFRGTNTYLVGMTDLAVVDPGPLLDDHVEAILSAAGGRPITHILLTHRHRDHSAAIPILKARTGAEVAAAALKDAPEGLPHVDYDLVPDRVLEDGEVIAGESFRLSAIATPGHARDHLCFALESRGLLFSGDHVMAWNTTIVAPPEGSMADYMASLEKLAKRRDTLFLPGHGGRLENPARTARAYLVHRRWREQMILNAIRAGTRTIAALVPQIYPAVEGNVARVAGLTIAAHVVHLMDRGLVGSDGAHLSVASLYPV